MKKLDVKHFLGIYQGRQKMYLEGITTPTEEGKRIIDKVVSKLSEMDLSQEIRIENNALLDSHGNVVVQFPDDL